MWLEPWNNNREEYQAFFVVVLFWSLSPPPFPAASTGEYAPALQREERVRERVGGAVVAVSAEVRDPNNKITKESGSLPLLYSLSGRNE